MPELPEVETIRRVLINGGPQGPSLVDRKIVAGHVLWVKTIAEPEVEIFIDRISGQTINGIGRRGKYLVFDLSQDKLLVHLRMSGDLLIETQDEELQNHCRVSLDLDNGQRLVFIDTRKFGRMWLVRDESEILSKLGPEPLDEDFSPEVFYSRMQRYQRQIKPLLLDQSFLAGMGNIYTDEALFLARIHPQRISRTITRTENRKLWKSIRRVLNEGIDRCGASIDWVYRGGDFQNYFNVYQRTGDACPVCGTEITKLFVAQRGTHVCPNCQML